QVPPCSTAMKPCESRSLSRKLPTATQLPGEPHDTELTSATPPSLALFSPPTVWAFPQCPVGGVGVVAAVGAARAPAIAAAGLSAAGSAAATSAPPAMSAVRARTPSPFLFTGSHPIPNDNLATFDLARSA